MDVLRGGKRVEIASVFRYENKVVFHTPGQNVAVRRAQPAEVAGMHGDVNALGIQSLRNLRGQTLIEKQPHRISETTPQAAFSQGLPDGRPRRGWALA